MSEVHLGRDTRQGDKNHLLEVFPDAIYLKLEGASQECLGKEEPTAKPPKKTSLLQNGGEGRRPNRISQRCTKKLQREPTSKRGDCLKKGKRPPRWVLLRIWKLRKALTVEITSLLMVEGRVCPSAQAETLALF